MLTDRQMEHMILEVSQWGLHEEFLAQFIASCCAPDMNVAEAAEFVVGISNRVSQLLQEQNQIWEGLMPGPGRPPEPPDGQDWYEVRWYNYEGMRIGSQTFHEMSALNLVPMFFEEQEEHVAEFITITHLGKNEMTYWDKNMAKFVLRANEINHLSRNMFNGETAVDDDIFQALYEAAIQEAKERGIAPS
jgi:hypothetical protein